MRRIVSWFTSLLDLLRINGRTPSIAPSANLGLDESDIAKLRSLRASEGFASLLKLLDTTTHLYAEQLLAPQSRDAATLHEFRGVLIGLRKAAYLVDETLQHADDLANSRRHALADERARADSRIIALYSSPYFK